jgi:hypothetical protein
MTKVDRELARGFSRWLIKILVALNVIVWLAAAAHCQHERHEDREEWEDAIGFAAVEVTSADERLIYYKRTFRFRVKLGSFGFDQTTQFPEGRKPGRYCAIYCRTHSWLYSLTPCPEPRK